MNIFIFATKDCSLYGNTKFICRIEHDIFHSFSALAHDEISCLTIRVLPRTRVLFVI